MQNIKMYFGNLVGNAVEMKTGHSALQCVPFKFDLRSDESAHTAES
jgi:hypothetical protein